MSSDIYEFKVTFENGLVATVSCIECRLDRDYTPEWWSIIDLKKVVPGMADVNLDPCDYKDLQQKILNKEGVVRYLGGYCSGGYSWGPDDVRHWHEDDDRDD